QDQPSRVLWTGTPFLGLESFRLSHAAVFSGREDAIRESISSLRSRAEHSVQLPSLLIAGASGCGKSSLARCGMAHRLRELLPDVPLVEMRPGDHAADDPIVTLAVRIQQATGAADSCDFAFVLRNAPQLALEQLQRLRQRNLPNSSGPCLVLILDQLEELFTAGFTSDCIRSFAAVIDLLVRRGVCWCVATIRSDLLDRLANYPEFSHFTEEGGLYVLRPATSVEIRR
ncbi:MAG: ATP-binding protein, partial [Planctomyces sp.]